MNTPQVQPRSLQSGRAAGLIDKNMAGVIQAQKNLVKSQDASAAPLPFPTISGPTAETVNSGQTNMGSLEFFARGGIENTVKGVVNTIAEKRREREEKKRYEEFLAQGEKGADALYQDAVSSYGEEIKNWIPPKTQFYDEKTGAFMPHVYAKHLAYGVEMYETALELARQKQADADKKLKEEEAKRMGLQTVGGIVGSAKTPQDAAAQIAQSGLNPGDYDKAMGTIPSDKDRAQTSYYNRMPAPRAGGEDKDNPQAIIDSLEKRKIEYEKLKQAKQAELRDPMKNLDVEVDKKILADIQRFESTIKGIERQIEEQKAKASGKPVEPPLSEKSVSIGEQIRSSLENKIPQAKRAFRVPLLGFKLGKDKEGYTIENNMVLDDKGNPQYGMYEDLMADEVVRMMQSRNMTLEGVDPADTATMLGIVKESIIGAGLEATIDALDDLEKGVK